MLVKLAQDTVPLLKEQVSFEPVSLKTEHKEAARAIMEDEGASATGVWRAAEMLLGHQIRNWEPESIWLEFQDTNIDVPVVNREKLLAANSLIVIPAFYWDANIFENTTLAFNNEPMMPELLQEASPGELSWAVYEAELLMYSQGMDPHFDYEPARYAAVVLHRDGFLLAPEMLVFAQEELDKLTRGHRELREEVRSRWEKVDKTKLDTLELEEEPVDVQLGLLSSVWLYIHDRAEQYRKDVTALTSA
jgi:hypothetical protein